MPELVIELDAVEARELKLEHLETALPSLGDAIELRHAAGQSAKTAADKARGECDRLICAAAALRGDPIPKGSALDGARQVELMAHDIERRSGGAA